MEVEIAVRARFERTDLIISVSSLTRSIEYYTRILGFELEMGRGRFRVRHPRPR